MMINKITSTDRNYNIPAFTSNSGYYKAPDGNAIGTFTNMFRSDLDWEGFTDFFVEHFKDKEKINFIQFASSDGSEAYTQIITLLEHHNDVDKFFPIRAYDIDPQIFKNAQSGLLNLSTADIVKMFSRNIDCDKYFESTERNLYIQNDSLKTGTDSFAFTYKVADVLKNRVQFKNADMYDVLYNHKDNSNSIILCRNVLKYLGERAVDHFTTLAACNLKKDSLFVIGEIDSPNIHELLEIKGFKKVMTNVFKKC